jgi:hypothetical protein
MSAQCLLSAIVLASLAAPPAAPALEQLHHVTAPAASSRAASPQCSAGVVYDDGIFNDAYSVGGGNPDDATMVMKFDLPPGTTGLDQVCACFTRLSAASPSSMGFEVVVYDDNGPGGQPGTLLGTAAANASGIPVFSGNQFYPVDLSGAGIALPGGSVYVGVRWPGGSILLCGDRSSSTPLRASYYSGNSGLSWGNVQTGFTNPPRALGVRLDPATSATACTPSATALCLGNGRFKVQATFATPGGQSGTAQVVKLTDETGYLWFFAASNVEAVVKVLNGCALNARYWVFAGGLTNVRTVITVTDTQTGISKSYTNPQSTAFQPIQDTGALAVCN